MKKVVLLLFTIMLLPLSVNAKSITNKNGIFISSAEYDRLTNLGFSENEIEYMPIDIYNENKNLIGIVVSTDTKYYKTIYYNNNKYLKSMGLGGKSDVGVTIEITEEEYNKENSNNILKGASSDTQNTEYKKMTTNITKVNGRYRVKNVLTWKKMPKKRSTDIIGIAINNAVVEPRSGSQKAYTTYYVSDSCKCASFPHTDYHDTKTNWNFTPNGYGVKFNLPKDSTYTIHWGGYDNAPYPCNDGTPTLPNGYKDVSLKVMTIETTMYYDLMKISNAAISAYGSYKHATSNVSINGVGFGISFGSGASVGITLDASLNKKYDSMPNTHAQLDTPNW